ncbi:hypothetical protein JW766_06815 [Candidatus Dojkabacteria bacterium]|nr:hypothetical protein [Candidatus Dojkabacteria bacterium]
MPRKWAYIIILTVFVLFLLSVWEVYRAFRKEKEVGQYERYVTEISREFDTDFLKGISKAQDDVPVKDEDIAPVQ